MIKNTLFAWLRGADAPPDDLHAQLAAATAAHAAAQLVVDKAVDAFDRVGDDAAAQTLDLARATERRLSDHVLRARRLCDAAKLAKQAAERAELEATRARMEAALTPAALEARRAPLAKKEAATLVDLVEVQAERWLLEVEIGNERAQADRTSEALGESARLSPLPTAPPSGMAVEALQRLIVSLPLRDVRRARAEVLLDFIEPHRRRLVAPAAE